MILEQLGTGLVFVLRLNTILGFQYRGSTQPRLQTFKIRLENESRVGTPIRRNLLGAFNIQPCLILNTNAKDRIHKAANLIRIVLS